MGVIEVTDFIICPNCGKKININTTKVVTADFFRYMICPECNGKFTKIPDSSRFYIKMHKISIYMLRILIIILTIISIYNSVNNDKSNLNYTIFQGIMLILVLILFIAVIMSLAINDHNCKRIIYKSRNGYLPIENSTDPKKVIDYIDEDLFCKTRKNKIGLDNSVIKNALILLPKANIIMTIPMISNIKALQIHDMYILLSDKRRYYAILADYGIDVNHITLYFKTMGKIPETDCCEQLDIITIENEMIAKAQVR